MFPSHPDQRIGTFLLPSFLKECGESFLAMAPNALALWAALGTSPSPHPLWPLHPLFHHTVLQGLPLVHPPVPTHYVAQRPLFDDMVHQGFTLGARVKVPSVSAHHSQLLTHYVHCWPCWTSPHSRGCPRYARPSPPHGLAVQTAAPVHHSVVYQGLPLVCLWRADTPHQGVPLVGVLDRHRGNTAMPQVEPSEVHQGVALLCQCRGIQWCAGAVPVRACAVRSLCCPTTRNRAPFVPCPMALGE